MSTTLRTQAQRELEHIKEVMQGDQWRIEAVHTFTHGTAIQVSVKGDKGRYKNCGPLLFPPEGGTTMDTLNMLGIFSVGGG